MPFTNENNIIKIEMKISKHFDMVEKKQRKKQNSIKDETDKLILKDLVAAAIET